MKLYDSVITETFDIIENYKIKVYKPDSGRIWKDMGKSELVMQRDSAFELGGSGLDSANYTCITSSPLVSEDEVLVVGPDLNELNGDSPFVRISVIRTSEELMQAEQGASLSAEQKEEENRAYNAIRNLEFVRYHVFPKGYMIRVSTTTHREQVRVSKAAIAAGISFSRVGSLYIRQYKAQPGVLNARVIFVTDPDAVKCLTGNAGRVDNITKTLDHILEGIELDCGHCNLKPVCDEVEGMREEHMKALGISAKQ